MLYLWQVIFRGQATFHIVKVQPNGTLTVNGAVPGGGKPLTNIDEVRRNKSPINGYRV